MHLSRRALLTGSLAVAAGGVVTALGGRGSAQAGAPPASVTQRAAGIVAAMTLEQRVGQLIAAGVPFGDSVTAGKVVDEYHVGTVFFAGRSHAGINPNGLAAQALQRHVTATTTHGVTMFTALDQEGGLVQALSGPGVSVIPSALVQAEASPATIRALSQHWAAQLRSAGFLLNLAPVTDVVPAADKATNVPIGQVDREFGASDEAVTRAVVPWIEGSLAARVQPVMKHFPGLGRVTANTDTSAHVLDTVTTRSEQTLAPWRAGLAAGCGAIMISSAVYALIDPHKPAFLSTTVLDGMIRGDLGFDGVVMTDDIGSAAAVQAIPLADRAIGFLVAGGDLLLNVVPWQIHPMYTALVLKARAQASFAGRVTQSATRVVALKAAAGLV